MAPQINQSQLVSYISIGLLSTISFVAIRSYFTTFSFWSRRGVKGPTPWPFFGNILQLVFNPNDEIDSRNSVKYGRIYGTYYGSIPTLVISDAEIIEEIYVKNFHQFQILMELNSPDPMDNTNVVVLTGEDWKRHRSVITQGLSPVKIKQMFQYKRAEEMLKFIRNQEGKDINMYDMFTFDMLNIVSRALYGLDLDLFNHLDHDIIIHAQKYFEMFHLNMFLLESLPLWLLSLFGIKPFNQASSEYLKQFVSHAVQERLKNPDVKKNDLLQTLMNAEHELAEGKKMSEIEIMSNAVLMLAASFDGSASAAALVAYELAKNLDKQGRIQRDIELVLDGREELEYEDLSKFVYLEAFINETLRLHTPDPRGFRSVSDPNGATIPTTDIHLPARTGIVIPHHTLHHDPEYWPEPYAFKPERFLPENKHNIKNCSFMAFGAGPRMCPGIRLAMVSMKHSLIEILRNYSFKTCQKTPPKIVCRPGEMGVRLQDIFLRLEKRAVAS